MFWIAVMKFKDRLPKVWDHCHQVHYTACMKFGALEWSFNPLNFKVRILTLITQYRCIGDIFSLTQLRTHVCVCDHPWRVVLLCLWTLSLFRYMASECKEAAAASATGCSGGTSASEVEVWKCKALQNYLQPWGLTFSGVRKADSLFLPSSSILFSRLAFSIANVSVWASARSRSKSTWACSKPSGALLESLGHAAYLARQAPLQPLSKALYLSVCVVVLRRSSSASLASVSRLRPLNSSWSWATRPSASHRACSLILANVLELRSFDPTQGGHFRSASSDFSSRLDIDRDALRSWQGRHL